MGSTQEQLFRWLPAILYAGAIFVGSQVSGPSAERIALPWDKLLHVAEYTVLGILLARATTFGKPPSCKVLLFAALLGTAYGLFDELHQAFVPGRSANLADLAADTAGVLTGIAIWKGIVRLHARRLRPTSPMKQDRDSRPR